MRRFDIRKLRKLAADERYRELFYHWHEAEQMVASNFPSARRYGRRLKKRVEKLHGDWFGMGGQTVYTSVATTPMWSPG